MLLSSLRKTFLSSRINFALRKYVQRMSTTGNGKDRKWQKKGNLLFCGVIGERFQVFGPNLPAVFFANIVCKVLHKKMMFERFFLFTQVFRLIVIVAYFECLMRQFHFHRFEHGSCLRFCFCFLLLVPFLFALVSLELRRPH